MNRTEPLIRTEPSSRAARRRAARRRHAAAGTLALAASAQLLSGCALTPPYRPPAAATESAAWAEAARRVPEGWKLAQPGDELPRGAWWSLYGDPQLSELAARVEADNPSVQQALARVAQAQAAVAGARAAVFPAINGTASVTRSNSPILGSVRPTTPVTIDSVGASTSWEVDLWGRLRTGLAAGVAQAQASRGDLAAMVLSMQSQLAQSYLQLRVVDAQRALLDRTIEEFSTALRLTENRYAAGVAQGSDVTQARTQLEQARAQRVDLDATRAQLEHAIAVLVGRAPADFALPPSPSPATLAAAMPDVPVASPAQLLERRPDVAAAERRLFAANAQIGIARAALYPTLTLSASAGYRSNTLSNLISLPNRFWSLVPSLAAPLFDAGLRRSQVEQAAAVYDQNLAAYRQTVLTAVQEVEDDLALLSVLAEESRIQARALEAARGTLERALNQYRAGTVGYLNVVSAQTAALSSEQALLSLLGRRFAASVSLVRSMGGAWMADTTS